LEITPVDDLSSQFLDAFASIERHLRKLLDARREVSFYELVEKAATTNRVIDLVRIQLKEFADLRNFIIHGYRRVQPLASPSTFAVKKLRAIRDDLISPPKLVSLCHQRVRTCAPSDPIGSATRIMHEGSFSQIPVYKESKMVGLLTAETVARWLACRLANGEGILEEEAVEEVLKHEEGTHQHKLMSREATVFDAVASFEDAMQSGKILDAIVLTTNGKKTETPIGIVAVSDIPRLNKAIAH
jgi:predicted transcriptional regulator